MGSNLYEWVADWAPRSTHGPGWFAFSNDQMCLSGADTGAPGPGVLLRGGSYAEGTLAGPLAVIAGFAPSGAFVNIGSRCAR